MLYLNNCFDGSKKLQRELMKKLSNYKQQDKKKNRYNEDKFIKTRRIIGKISDIKIKV